VSNGVCCADYNWPGKNLLCRCEAYNCRQTGPTINECRCGTGVSGDLVTCSGTCCQTDYGCECGPDVTCSSGTPVSSCTTWGQKCRSDQQRVDSCSGG
jgi:hypothetical protein